jgi:6-phosphogluconate dehydrogenase
MRAKDYNDFEFSIRKKRKKRKFSKHEKDLFLDDLEYDIYYNKIKSFSKGFEY